MDMNMPLQAVLKNSKEATIATNRNGSIVYINEVAEKLIGKTSAELMGKNLVEHIELLDQGTGDVVELPLARVIDKQEFFSTDQGLIFKDANGKYNMVKVVVAPLKMDLLAVNGAVLTLGILDAGLNSGKKVKAGNSPNERKDEMTCISEYFFVKKDGNFVKVLAEDVLWIEAMENYAIIVGEKERYIVHSTLKSLAAKLKDQNFLRVHRSYIVPLDKIDAIEDNRLYVGEQSIPIGKSFRSPLMNKLMFI